MSTFEGVSSVQCADDLASSSSTGPCSAEDGKPSLFKAEQTPIVSSPPSPVGNAGEGSRLAQIMSWLTLAGFRTDVSLPAAFEVDGLQQGQQTPAESDAASSTSTGALSASSTIVDQDLGTVGHNRGAPPRTDPGVDSWSHTSKLEQRYVCGLRHDIFQHLVENVRQMLIDSSESDGKVCSRSITEKAGNDSPAEKIYTLEDVGLESIVARVVRVLEALHHASILSFHDRRRQNRPVGRESIRVSKAILPQAPKEADTATTITVPQTYITPMVWEEQHPLPNEQPRMYQAMTATTTLLSHSTVASTTEISWTTSNRVAPVPNVDDDPAAPHLPSCSRSCSVGCPSGTTDTGGQERKIRANVDSVSFPPQETSSTRQGSVAETASRAYVDSYPSAKPSEGSSESSIISFPALRVRHCTNDWLSPPAATPAAMGRSDANLYNAGIDAHTGPNGFFSFQPPAEKPVAAPGVPTDDLNFAWPAFASGYDPMVPDNHGNDNHKLGTSIGTSAGRKRSSHHAVPPDVEAGGSSMLQRLRQGSVQLGHALASAVGGSGHAQQPQRAGQGRRASSVDRMKAILDRTSPRHGATDSVGNPRVGMVVSSSEVRHRSCDACSEDGRPHICIDDTASSIGSR
jgi:hypothetical protein